MAGDPAVKSMDMRFMVLRTVAILLLGSCMLAACGKKGPPDPPGPASAITYPKAYPTY